MESSEREKGAREDQKGRWEKEVRRVRKGGRHERKVEG